MKIRVNVTIRLAKHSDLESINRIYNQSVPTQCATADCFPVSMQQREAWFQKHTPEKYPVFVAETGQKIVGWLSFSAYRAGRRALRHTAEISYYIATDYQGKGIATQLFAYVLSNAQRYGISALLAILLEHNTASRKLLEKYGFERWGRLPDIVRFENRTASQLIYGRHL